ncbi:MULTISPECIES: flagellar hook-associated protein FlgL [unclassified Halomonas]|uniref:flagellar hook-associated protein FlgL n=1 Tax=unclassified Halomonas TaxID=2609666 RepID=UPI0009908B39|nr:MULTISPECIES: flagellar hook-associated protein FlgL [unclassified Halomonas]AQU84578.1 flagellar biosynthesis protein FlgL [Halomonas sp. 'Soap Lake \
MRVSTITMFEQSTASINRQQSSFLKVSQQIASTKRVVNPSDDPQAAARAIGVDQSKAMTKQFADARVAARNSLAQTESVVNSISDAVMSAKSLLVRASSDTFSDTDRESFASELKGIYETMLGQANATDGNGRYLFGGYKDNSPPFVKSADGSVGYVGDTSARQQRVDSSRLMPVTETGATIFQSVSQGAGYIAEAQDNQGSVTFSGPRASDMNHANYGESFKVVFGEEGGEHTYSVQRFDGTGYVDFDPALTDQPYSGDGQQVAFGGVSLTLSGAPVAGDEFLVTRAGSDERPADLFKTMEQAIQALETPAVTDADKANLRNTLNTAMRDLDNGLDNVLMVRASAGARLEELNVIDAVGSNRMINYEQTLSDLVDLDLVAAISEYSLRQIGLQAAQKTFMDLKGMSLFDYM